MNRPIDAGGNSRVAAEFRTPHRKRRTLPLATGVLALAVGGAVIAGCDTGQTAPPSPTQIEKNLQYFDLPGVTAKNGKPVVCVLYEAGTNGTNQSKSWFAFDCDFTGTAKFPPATEPAPPGVVPTSSSQG